MSEERRPQQGILKPKRGPMGRHLVIGMPVEKARDFKGTSKRLLLYLKKRRLQLFAVMVMAVLSTVFSIYSPKVMGQATTILFEGVMKKVRGVPGAGVDFAQILRIIYILAALYVISSVFSYLQHYIMAGVSQKTVYDLRNDVNEKLSRLPLQYFDSRSHGEVLSRVTNDIDNISTTLQQSMTQLITSIITLIGIMAMMLTINIWMTLIAALILPLSFLITARVAKSSQKFYISQQKTLGEINGHVEEMLTGHVIVKAFGNESKSIERFKDLNNKLYTTGWKAQFISGLIMPLLNFVNNIGYVLVCIVGSIFVTKRIIEIGDIQAFIQYSRQFTHPIINTASIANIFQSTIASAERVFEILDETEEIPDPEKAISIDSPRGEVSFKDVRFGYSKDVTLIENMNIDVQRGQTVAIVGPTGAGKTTLVNLLMRYYEIEEGRIAVDGVDIRNLKRADLRGIFGMVLQDTWLFNGTIRDNIAYGRANASETEIISAAKAARADHFIRTLPEGYNTILNEEASNISQGQKQLLTIARAILANPAVLILDEATSSVDTRTEMLLQKAMTDLMKGRTSFVIAHRLSTIREADLILVLEKGSIIEKGTHKELLARKGFYADLYNSQFTGQGMEETG